MQAVTLKDAKRNLSRLVEQVLADAEPRIVVTDKGEQVVLMPLDELPGYLGEGVRAGRRMPDRLSSFLWFAQRAYDYDQSKGRVHVEEILKKQMAYGFVTAQQFEEERRLYGVELEPEDRAAIDHLLADMQNGRKEQ